MWRRGGPGARPRRQAAKIVSYLLTSLQQAWQQEGTLLLRGAQRLLPRFVLASPPRDGGPAVRDQPRRGLDTRRATGVRFDGRRAGDGARHLPSGDLICHRLPGGSQEAGQESVCLVMRQRYLILRVAPPGDGGAARSTGRVPARSSRAACAHPRLSAGRRRAQAAAKTAASLPTEQSFHSERHRF